jgi:hypothetical protein
VIAGSGCADCEAEGFVMFYLPGAWEGGLCQGCAERQPKFAEYFGSSVVHVRDGDSGKGQPKGPR